MEKPSDEDAKQGKRDDVKKTDSEEASRKVGAQAVR